ncbi:hypothetical protein BMG00_13270 [Thioclava marina]|uniref:Invasion associated locus B family protein n=1 Tax=Thioclava marina TaxID=1915077 RepID=A0ABX3MPN0_9RHOB|nr:hypothetical protein BMG00_13270 [Thioclava marina]
MFECLTADLVRVSLTRAVLCVVGITLFSSSADAAPQSWAFRDWSATCPGTPQPCIASTTTFAKDRTWLATLRVQPADKGGVRLQVLLPQQIHLGSGAFAQVPGHKAQELRLIQCVPGACEARLDLDAQGLAGWKRASSATLTYRPAPNVPPISFDVSLMGLTKALERAGEGDGAP